MRFLVQIQGRSGVPSMPQMVFWTISDMDTLNDAAEFVHFLCPNYPKEKIMKDAGGTYFSHQHGYVRLTVEK